jgi:signal transduction histidine kinase
MTLRQKLLLVALCTLALPIAGWFNVRQMEALLRNGQAQALQASAQVVARSLVVTHALPSVAGPGWYVQQAPGPITVDGYGDDWAPLTPWNQSFPRRGQLLLAEDDDGLYLNARVSDARRTRADTADANALLADHLILSLGNAAGQRRYLLASAAPGSLDAVPLDPAVPGLPDRLGASWQEDGSGYQVELRLPRGADLRVLGIGAYDASAGGDRLAVETRPLRRYSTALSHELAQLVPDRVQARVLSPSGWLLARSGKLDSAAGADDPGWFASLVYRSLLATRLEDANLWSQDVPRLDTREVEQARAGKAISVWRHGEERGSVVLATTVPIEQADRIEGVLLLAGGILLAFATRLSLRLARLRNAAERAQLTDGRLDGQLGPGRFPMTDAPDEIGDLARSFEKLFVVVGGYTDYLRTLASRLSHELNTPLAIVKSSLDNLEHALQERAALPDQAVPYLARARDGVARLGMLVRAMSESSRMERSIEAAEPEDVDLRDVVRGCAEGYRALVGTRALEYQLPPSPLPLHGAPELIAQALDKLLDNALSFTPEQGWLRLVLRPVEGGAEIELANQGPLLPDAMQGRLFDSLVSLRDKATHGEAPHLGLGLYVVRLIAERHGGSVSARNLDDGSGVAFRLTLHGMPRQRLG